MEEEALTPFGLVEVLDKFHVAVTTYMELARRDDNNYHVNL